MKLRFLSLLLSLACATLAHSQPGGNWRNMDPEQRAEQQTKMMVEKLSLSEAQAAKAKEINLRYAQKTKELRDATPEGEREAMREKMSALRKEQDAELRKIMTSDQWAIWEKYQEEERSKRGNWQREGGQKPPEKKPSEQKTEPAKEGGGGK